MVPGVHGPAKPGQARLSLAWTEAEVPGLSPACTCRLYPSDTSIGVGTSSVGKPGGGPIVDDTPLMEGLAVVVVDDTIEA